MKVSKQTWFHPKFNNQLMLKDSKEKLIRYRKPIIITSAVIILQLLFGFDPKFFIINILWLLL